MSDTTQLKALRDATIAYYGAKMSSDLVDICDHAIASLEADEQPPAEQAQQPAPAGGDVLNKQGGFFNTQPAPADVPPMPKPGEMWGHERILALHAACVRIAAERDEARRNANEAHERFMQAASERDEAAARNEGILADMQMLLRQRNDARRELEAERAGRPGSINALTITSLRERLAEAEAELAALKGQEPLFWVEDTTEDDEHNPFDRYRIAFDGSQCPTAFAVYTAPVPPPDSVPREQHEAALAQARREERERCAKVCDELAKDARRTSDRFESHGDRDRSHQWEQRNAQANECARVIRALAEKGGEVGK